MRFKQFLVETLPAPGRVNQTERLNRIARAKQKRETDSRLAQTASTQPQLTQAAATQRAQQTRDPKGRYAKPAPSTGFPQRPAATSPDTINMDGSKPAPESPAGPQRPVSPNASKPVNMEFVPQEVLKMSQGNRQAAVEFMTLLGSMYQTKRKNPEVQMTLPKMVEQSKNRPQMEALFKAAKGLSLPQLASMTQEIKKVAAAPGTQTAQAGPAPAGQTNVPQTPGQTQGQKTMLQKLVNLIQQAKKSLSPQDLKVAKDQLKDAAKGAKANPMQAGRQQPTNRPVVTQG